VVHKLLPPVILLPLLTLVGCGGRGALPRPTATKHVVIPTRTPAPVTFNVPTQPPATLPPVPTAQATALPTRAPRPTPMPSPTTEPATAPTKQPAPPAVAQLSPRLIAASVQPAVVPAGGTVQASVTTAGGVQRVELYLGSGAPPAPPPVAYSLVEIAPGTWTGTGAAPTVGGQYHFTVGLYDHLGRRTVVDRDGWNIEVSAQPTSAPPPAAGQAQPLPADIPLAPPFSYGNPVPAVFSARGESVSGSEVVSTTRPDVQPSFVARFYSLHLPRAGWSVDQSGLPGPGATSFTISASMTGTNGTSVCIVQYSASTIHIFYGSIVG